MCNKSGSTIYKRQPNTDIKDRVRRSKVYFSSNLHSCCNCRCIMIEKKTAKENFELDLTNVLLNVVRYQVILETFFIELYPVCQARRIWFGIDIKKVLNAEQ